MTVFVQLMGGSADGKVYGLFALPLYLRVPVLTNDIRAEALAGLRGEQLSLTEMKLGYDEYRRETIATPDHWTQPVYVHPDVDLTKISEARMIAAIMEPWREQHRRMVKPRTAAGV